MYVSCGSIFPLVQIFLCFIFIICQSYITIHQNKAKILIVPRVKFYHLSLFELVENDIQTSYITFLLAA